MIQIISNYHYDCKIDHKVFLKSRYSAGDFCQLPPVKDLPLFTNEAEKKNRIAQVEGAWLYRFFNTSVRLTESKRQKDDLAFASLLKRVASGTYTAEDLRLLE